MLRYILSGMLLLIVSTACQNDCEENAPKPLSFNVQWVDAKGGDIYGYKEYVNKHSILFGNIKRSVYRKSKNYNLDSVVAFYKGARDSVFIKLEVQTVEAEDERLHILDVMPLVREAFYLQLDTVFVGPKSSDIDTVVLKVVREENDCFSTLYRFEKLEYNGMALSGIDTLYKIEK